MRILNITLITITLCFLGFTNPASAQQIVDASTYSKRTEFDNAPYRFDMEQNGRRMSADEFDAWMIKRGIRVAGRQTLPSPKNASNTSSAMIVSNSNNHNKVIVSNDIKKFENVSTNRLEGNIQQTQNTSFKVVEDVFSHNLQD